MKATTLLGAVLMITGMAMPADAEFRYRVRHDHWLGGCDGTLVLNEGGVRFESEEDHSVELPYLEIQQLGIDLRKVHLVTWEDRPRLFGKDRIMHFEILEGELSPALIPFLEERLGRPLVTSVIPEAAPARFVLPVHHRGFLQGSDGVLEVGEDRLAFRTEAPGQSRHWRWEDVLGYGSTGPYQLRVSVMERTGGQMGEARNFVFSLKRRLPSEMMDFFWRKVHGDLTAQTGAP